ncbi:TetR/AcrR family transcriptional regulator [Cohnella suwonensis]|uniref:TetR/AcrR family transcriptional regulator n=1 Tax=Cohnella suwonensis TaxID=696072 RepID=A0ABW0M4J2_9BACL
MKKNKFQLKREATYRKLIEAADKCFLEKGFAATTIGDIVAITGHTNGAFYGHFESKEQLFLHILDYRQELSSGWTETPKQYRPENTTLEEVVTISVMRLQEMLKGNENFKNWILVLVDFYMQTKHKPELHSVLKNKYQEWVAGIANFIDALKEQGWVSQDKDSHQIAKLVLAYNDGFSVNWVLFEGPDPQSYIQGLVRLLS